MTLTSTWWAFIRELWVCQATSQRALRRCWPRSPRHSPATAPLRWPVCLSSAAREVPAPSSGPTLHGPRWRRPGSSWNRGTATIARPPARDGRAARGRTPSAGPTADGPLAYIGRHPVTATSTRATSPGRLALRARLLPGSRVGRELAVHLLLPLRLMTATRTTAMETLRRRFLGHGRRPGPVRPRRLRATTGLRTTILTDVRIVVPRAEGRAASTATRTGQEPWRQTSTVWAPCPTPASTPSGADGST